MSTSSAFENLSKADKRKARELAMQAMFVWDSQGSGEATLNAKDKDLAAQVVQDGQTPAEVQNAALRLAVDAWEARGTSDQWVERLAPKWPPRRQPGVDRNLLRLAIYEITTGHAPPKVAIDEAIELAKSFSTEQSPAFVNGVLDAVHKEQQSLLKM